ncbi:MAG: Gfo/Idh/MocA family oxidoreductase [Verrucomicrobia bacterium]|nr:Gfo/Idh/MocA family oxidoreductase [Verrucomicrobiota bacterium]
MAEHSILIIGCGSIGERHLRCFQRTGRTAVTACDANPALLQRVAQTYQVPAFGDWEMALAQGSFDAVVVCTPAHLHVAMAVRVLQRGGHVLIEKPLAQSLSGVDDLLRARDHAGRQAAVAYVLHVYPLLIQARDFLQGGEFGAIRHVTSTSGQHFPGGRPAHTAHYSQTYYRDRKTGGGAIQDALTHTANWVERVIGPADSILCDCSHQVLPGVTVEDTVNLSARHGDILANYTLNQFQAPNESTLQFNTAIGSVKIEVHNRRWGTFRLGDSAWNWREVPPADRDAPFIAQANCFLDQIEGRSAQLCTLEAALQTLRFNLAALASADTGVRVFCASIKA